jgi:GNAT superfamily N-acetyltransferase
MEFRNASPEDAESLTVLSVASKNYWGYSDEFMSAVLDELTVTPQQITDGYCEIAVIDGNPAGFILLLPFGESLELEALFISPDLIGRGVGQNLLERATSWAKAKGYRYMQTTADPNAVGFYEKQGFEKIGDISSVSIPGRVLPRLEIDLHAI